MSDQDVPAIDYTARDFLTIKEALKTYLQAKFPTTWKDFYESGMGIALVDLIAYSHDVLSFFTDYTANEVFLPTARDRLSILLLGRLVGYQLRTPTSASVVCSMSIASTYTEAIIIPAGTTLESENGINFVTTEEARISAGDLTGDITFVEGINRSTDVISDGSVFQKVVLAEPSVIQDTISITVDGDIWAEVGSLTYADANDKAFSVQYDENGVATIQFGDGDSGLVPTTGSVISIAYRTGGGIAGNIALAQLSGTVQGTRELVLPVSSVTVNVLNDTERGSGGEEAETIAHAKLWIPAWVRANGRAVTESDYDALGNSFSDPVYGSPAYTKAKLKQEIPELNTVMVYVWGRDSGGDITTASSGLKNAIEEYFNDQGSSGVRMLCQHAEVADGAILYIDIDTSIKVATSFVVSNAITATQEAIDDLFGSTDVIPGDDFRISALYDAVHSLASVQYCLVNLMTASYKTTETIGIGNTTAVTFGATLTLDSGLSIIPLSVRMYYGSETEVLLDDGEGNIVNGVSTVVGSVDYETGVIAGTFDTAPALGVLVKTEFRYELDYQRGDVEATGDGTTQLFDGSVKYPPVNPYDTLTGLKGIAFSDGTQVVYDDGDGNLIGDVDAGGQNIIDYGTGGYNFTFANPPPLDAEIRSTYRQILRTNSEDIPVDKNQISVKGLVTVSTL